MLFSTNTTWSLLLIGVVVFSFVSTSPVSRDLKENEDYSNEIDVDGDDDLIHVDKVDGGINSDVTDEEIGNEETDEEDNIEEETSDSEKGSDEETIITESEEDRKKAGRDAVQEEILKLRKLIKEMEEDLHKNKQEAEVVGDHDVVEEDDKFEEQMLNYVNDLSKWYLEMRGYAALK